MIGDKSVNFDNINAHGIFNKTCITDPGPPKR